jgi:hypothetical protein
METTKRYQKAWLRTWLGVNANGEPVTSAPVDVDVRWTWGQQAALNAQGGTIALDAVAVVDREISVDSEMWLAPDSTYSALEQWLGTGSAGDESGVMTVQSYKEVSDIRNRGIRREVGLAFAKDTPATS